MFSVSGKFRNKTLIWFGANKLLRYYTLLPYDNIYLKKKFFFKKLLDYVHIGCEKIILQVKGSLTEKCFRTLGF